MASAGNNFCRVAGPALGAPILALWGAGWSFVVYALTSALVAALLVPIHLRSRLEAAFTITPRGPATPDAVAGLEDAMATQHALGLVVVEQAAERLRGLSEVRFA